MPLLPLAPFATFDPAHFRLGGNPGTLHAAATRWRDFGEAALSAASSMRSINDGGFVGTEGDRFRELVNGDFPKNLTTTGNAHVGVADAIAHYARALEGFRKQMSTVRADARIHHQAVQLAVAEVNAAEAAAAGTAGAAAPEVAAAMAKYETAKGLWEADIQAANGIKDSLGGEVRTQVAAIAQEAKERFEENPHWLKQAWDDFAAFMREHADIISLIADALQIIGGILMFVCPVLGAILVGVGVGLKMLLAASGGCSWAEALFDLATAGPLGVFAKSAKAGKLGGKVANIANKTSKAGNKAMSAVKAGANKAALKSASGVKAIANEKLAKSYYKTVTRGKQICFAAEPVDMATGNMVDFETDIFIDGILPITVDRNANTNHELGRALGPRWVSTMDVRIEICEHEVLMASPDGALLTFPPAPEDGSEVRADGRPWLLSYADGHYRVRDIAAGVTYIFRLFDTPAPTTDGVGVEDRCPSLGGSHVAATIPHGSLAETFNMGIEVGLSTVVHHTGATIDYTWDTATGHMVRMRRSDDTVLDIQWDDAVGRVAHIFVSNPTTHPGDEPLRLISYEYDPHGQLVRVINSNDGALKYHYDDQGRMYAWTDRNGVSYYYRFDEQGRVHSQVGTGGMFPNILYWGHDTGQDAPLGGTVCVLIETAGEFQGDPLTLGDTVVEDYFNRLEQLPLYQALVEGGLDAAGLTGRGRTAKRDDDTWTVPQQWLHDDVLGDIRPTVYRSTPEGDVWRTITPEGVVVDSVFNEYHQETAVVSPAGAIAEFHFNDDGVQIGASYEDGTEYRIEPAAWGTPARLIGRDGLVTEFDVDVFGMIQSVTKPSGLTTLYTYEVRPEGIVPTGTSTVDGVISQMECDGAGRIIARTDGAGRRVSHVRDVRGLVVETMDPAGATTTIQHTPEGWPCAIELADGSKVSAAYDGEGNKVAATNELGASTFAQYTVFDRPVVTTDASGAVTRLEYNTQMEPIRLTNADGNTWTYTYNLDGTAVKETDYNGIVRETVASIDGLSAIQQGPEGTSQQTYHHDGRVATLRDKTGLTSYFYDDVGRLDRVVGPQARVAYTRDEFGRVIEETVVLATGETTTHRVDLDPSGLVDAEHIDLAMGNTFSTSFMRDEYGEIRTSIHTRTSAGAPQGQRVADISYGVDERGIRNRIGAGSTFRSSRVDSRGRVVSDHVSVLDSDASVGHHIVSAREYSWRPDTVLASVADHLRGTTEYQLDILGRVTGVSRSAETARSASFMAENAMDETYGFSLAGMLTKIDAPFVQLGSTNPLGGNRHDTAGRSFDTEVEFKGTLPTRVGRTTYTYDAAGRVTQTVTKRISQKPLVHQFFYGSDTQPIGFTSSDEPGVGYRYLYDPLGRRVAKERVDTESGAVLTRTIFTHAGDQLVAEEVIDVTSGAGVLRSGHVWTTDPVTGGVTGQVQFSGRGPEDTGDFRAEHPADWTQAEIDAEFRLIMDDLSGAPLEFVDPDSGRVTGYCQQSLYGVRTWHGETSTPLLFAGQYLDSESGWAYNRFRYYCPSAGIYNAQDPLGLAPRLASAQGYVDHAGYVCDPFGLQAHVKNLPKDQRWRIVAHNKGVVGEQAAADLLEKNGMKMGKRDAYTIGDRNRISDGHVIGSDGNVMGLAEVKNVKEISMTQQIQDAVAFNKKQYPGTKLNLFVRGDTHVASTVLANDDIVVHRMSSEILSDAETAVRLSDTKSLWLFPSS